MLNDLMVHDERVSIIFSIVCLVACQCCPYSFVSKTLFFLVFLSAPSAVSIIHQVSRTPNSITLSWSQPNQPNGVILDYELQYYEKVRSNKHYKECVTDRRDRTPNWTVTLYYYCSGL